MPLIDQRSARPLALCALFSLLPLATAWLSPHAPPALAAARRHAGCAGSLH
eukprot:CAMPEP_0206257804 /NCGR_PEP_ID=MMETSP0047_2-20121206/25554_1 /ASSEMBLY_ACC=CAM_ASM_000192 /TAXON_ID=195065 /ORGANISM="Chroomonas mesostigmatica_cf, Strain CCMP1168" /LENGTH=50 /DNA_ID=CAMNT_0053684451 /DNA_START=20 /DNA_END=169 /DNA_ORIENTATION=-